MMAFLILLSGSDQIGAQKLNIHVFGKSNSKMAGVMENILKNKIQNLLFKQYPCASTLTDNDVTVMLEFERQRALMGSKDEDVISNVAGALGAQFVVSVNVTQVNSTITMNVSGLDDRRGKAVAKQAAVVQSEKEAIHAAEELAEKFVSDLINSMPDCYVNEWVGTITYRRDLHGETQTTEEGFSVSGTTTTEITTKSVVEASFEVRGTKRPARTTVILNEESLRNAITKQTFTCPGTTPFEQGKTVTRNVTEVEKTTGKAEGKVDAVASVSVDGDEYSISFTVPEIEGGIGVRDWTWKDSGGCGPPENKHESTSISLTTFEEYGQANGKIDPAKPDVLTGSKTIKVPSPPGIQETKIITWDLNFKRVPSTKKQE